MRARSPTCRPLRSVFRYTVRSTRTVKAMAGRAADFAQRGQDKHLHYSRDVTVEEMRQASMALMRLTPLRTGRTSKR